MKRSIFKVVDPLPKPEPAAKRSRKRPPSSTVVHKSLGEGQLVGLRLGESGIWLADVKFDGARRTLQVQAEHWVTAISDILKLLPHFPPPKLEKATPGITHWPAHDDESADSEAGDTEDSVLDSGDDGDTEPELGEQRVEEGEDEVEAEEIGVDA
jgi:hypothetical protein